jgi:chromosome segregation ATPase
LAFQELGENIGDALADAIWVAAIASVEQTIEERRQTLEAEALEVRAAATRLEAASGERIATLTADLVTVRTDLALATQRVQSLLDQLSDREAQLAARDQTIAGQLGLMAEKDTERRQLLAELERHEVDRRDILVKIDQVRQEARTLDVANSAITTSLADARDTAGRLRIERDSLRLLVNKSEGEARLASERLAEMVGTMEGVKIELMAARSLAAQAETSRQDLLRRAEVAEATISAMRAERTTRTIQPKKPRRTPSTS